MDQDEQNEKSQIEVYRELVKNRPVEIVGVTAPSGFVFKLKKPSKIGLILSTGKLPHYAASQAVNAWQKRGMDTSALTAKDVNELTVAEQGLQAFDKLLELSHEPRIVAGLAENDNEFSAAEIIDEDMEYLLRWVISGGDAAVQAAMFPEGPRPDAGAGTNGGKVQGKTKQARRAARVK